MVMVMVAGFAFKSGRVLLVHKKNPLWQNGLWNGVGGKVEDRETPIDAMVREFREEVGVELQSWTHFCTEIGPGYVVHFYRTDALNVAMPWPSHNDVGELLAWTPVGDIYKTMIKPTVVGNLSWLIPLAMDPRGFERPVIVEAAKDIKERPTWW